MLVSLNWLKEYVNIDMEPNDLGEALTMSGTKVETMTIVSGEIENIVTGKIKAIEAHPDADKLVICTIDFGDYERRIVTAAKNVFAGAVVPVALDRAVLADRRRISNSSFRGVLSQGMLCSVEELGMDKDLFSKEVTEGIYILPENTKVGQDIKELLWLNDIVIVVELTANRPDCQSVYGLAREIAATLDTPLKTFPIYDRKEDKNEIANHLSISIDNDACLRYVAKMMRVKKIEPSPLWMQLKLINSGVRPINNIVDTTNYVMLELGQPLHAFDYDRLGSKEIVVKTTNDKKITTLDDKERSIDDSMLMITNGRRPLAIAGVMGGANSEITEDTQLIVLESACFDKNSIRQTAKELCLRTEASSRFEKGVDPELALTAALRASFLLEEIGAVEIIDGLIDVYKKVPLKNGISLDTNWVNGFIGIDLTKAEMGSILERLFFDVKDVPNHHLSVIPPSFRKDVRIKEDLAEEIARIYGYNKIPSTIMGGETLVGEKTSEQKYEVLLKQLLVGQGYYETLSSSFTSDNRVENLNQGLANNVIRLINPLGEENSLMRQSLIGHQLEIIGHNYHQNISRGRFFELANTYRQASDPNDLPIQEKKLVLSAYGESDFFDLKGVIELIFNESGIEDYEFISGAGELFHPGRKAEVFVQSEKIGEIGEIHPLVIKHYNLPARCYVCELSMDQLFSAKKQLIRYQELPKYPGSARDLAIVLKEDIPASAVAKIIKEEAGELLESLELFDVYTGEQVADKYKSLAYSLYFRHYGRTINDEDINPRLVDILDALKNKLDAKLRE